MHPQATLPTLPGACLGLSYRPLGLTIALAGHLLVLSVRLGRLAYDLVEHATEIRRILKTDSAGNTRYALLCRGQQLFGLWMRSRLR